MLCAQASFEPKRCVANYALQYISRKVIITIIIITYTLCSKKMTTELKQSNFEYAYLIDKKKSKF